VGWAGRNHYGGDPVIRAISLYIAASIVAIGAGASGTHEPLADEQLAPTTTSSQLELPFVGEYTGDAVACCYFWVYCVPASIFCQTCITDCLAAGKNAFCRVTHSYCLCLCTDSAVSIRID
jgi:hypothetical protein